MPISSPLSSSLNNPTWLLGSSEAATRAPRVDMGLPVLIFAGLFVTALAICGAIETRSALSIADDVKVLHHENVVGPLPNDYFTHCKREHNGAATNCHDNTSIETVSASTRSARE